MTDAKWDGWGKPLAWRLTPSVWKAVVEKKLSLQDDLYCLAATMTPGWLMATRAFKQFESPKGGYSWYSEAWLHAHLGALVEHQRSVTAAEKLCGRLRSFLRACQDREWVECTDEANVVVCDGDP